jgi:hypothetical protein
VLRISSDPLRLSLLLLIVLTLSQFHQRFPALAPLRPGLVATGLVALYAFLRPALLARGNPLRTWPAKLMLGFFVVACMSVVFGISMGQAGKYVLDSYGKTVVFAILVVAGVRNAKDLYTFGWAMVIAAAVLGYLAVFVIQVADAGGLDRLTDMGLYDANDVSCVLTAAIGFVLLHLMSSRPVGRLLSVLVLLLTLVAVARSGSRGGLADYSALWRLGSRCSL